MKILSLLTEDSKTLSAFVPETYQYKNRNRVS